MLSSGLSFLPQPSYHYYTALSMQNRFQDIHLVFWDFLAIFVDLGIVAVLFF